MKRNGIYFLCLLFVLAVSVFITVGMIRGKQSDAVAVITDQSESALTPGQQVGALENQQQLNPEQNAAEPDQYAVPVSLKDPVAESMEKIRSHDVGRRIAGIQELTRINPAEAVSVLYDSLNRLQAEPDIEGMIVLGMLNLAHADQYLTNSDLDYLYHNTVNDNISGRAARILAARGDDDLLAEHINKFKWPGDGYSTKTALKNLTELGALESKLAVSNVTPYLSSDNEEVKMQALLAVSLCANADNVDQVKPLLSDASEEVRARAEVVTDILRNRGKESPEPIDMDVTYSYGS